MFLAFAFASNAWALYDITQELPAWIKRLSIAEMVGVMAHSLAFALLDSLTVFIGLTLLAILLPESWLRKRYVAIGTAVAIITGIWMIYFHLNGLISARNIGGLGLWILSYVVVLGLAYFFIQRNDRVSRAFSSFAERLALLAGIYIMLDIFGVIVILVRNVVGVA